MHDNAKKSREFLALPLLAYRTSPRPARWRSLRVLRQLAGLDTGTGGD